MQIEVTVLIGITSRLHNQIERKDAICVFERVDPGDIGILNRTAFIQQSQSTLRVYIRDDITGFYSFFSVNFNSLYLLILYEDAGYFAFVQHRTSVGTNHIDQFEAHLHTAVYKTVGTFNVGVVDHGMLIESRYLF